MAIPKDILSRSAGMGQWSVLGGYRGSIAHGTYVPSSDPNSIDDKDAMFLCVPPPTHYVGLQGYGSRGTYELMEGEWDVVVYELKKAVGLLLKGNPNVLSLLWLPENMYLPAASDAGRRLVEQRSLFVGRHVFHPYVGYARAQLTAMERGAHKGYMGEKRKALVEQHGYDTKNASHLIRLLRQGIEFLKDGEMQVMREDAAELLAIKGGEWELERVKKEADRLFKRAEDAFDRSTLPVQPDRARVETLMAEIIGQVWEERIGVFDHERGHLADLLRSP